MNTVVTIENGMECVFIMKVHHGGLVHARTSANACKMQQKPFPSPLPFPSSKSIGQSDFEFILQLICTSL